MTTITFPYAVIYHGVFYPANAQIEVPEETEEKVEETEETEEKVEQAKPRGRKKNDN